MVVPKIEKPPSQMANKSKKELIEDQFASQNNNRPPSTPAKMPMVMMEKKSSVEIMLLRFGSRKKRNINSMSPITIVKPYH